MEPPEYDKRIVLHDGTGRVVSGIVQGYDYEYLYLMWDDGGLVPMSYEDFADLRKMGTIEVIGGIPNLVFP